MNVFIFRKWVSVVVLESTPALCITYVNMARHHPPTLRDPWQNVYCCGVTELKDDTQHGAQCSCTIPWNPINTMYDLSWIRTLTFKSSIRAYLDYLSLPGTFRMVSGWHGDTINCVHRKQILLMSLSCRFYFTLLYASKSFGLCDHWIHSCISTVQIHAF